MAPRGNHGDTYRLNLGLDVGGIPPGRNLNRCPVVATLATGRGFQTEDLSWLSLGKIRFIVEHGSRTRRVQPCGGGGERYVEKDGRVREVAVITPSILGTSHRIDIPVPELDYRLQPSQLLLVECACSAWYAEWIRYDISRSGTTTAAGIAARRHTSPLSK